ncbi:MAG TPA: amino acid ABC transporter permease [Clostridia bacterium]|nr:amino acid ABC transporter permease [Clostridia bacterium]
MSIFVVAVSNNNEASVTEASASAVTEASVTELSPFNQGVEVFKDRFRTNFISDKRYRYLVTGLKNTIIITVFAVLVGTFLGFVLASIRYSYEELSIKNKRGIGAFILKLLNFITKVYLTVIRGTPVLIQLMIIYYGIFAAVNINKILVAIIAFGINSGAYVAEIVRSGLSSVDRGQFEAGRSLGLSYMSTMVTIIIPQAFKNILPALANELIVLLKETSVAGYIALNDLTRGGDTIRGVTYNSMPLYAVALIYLIVVMILSHFVTKLENHLKTDRAVVRKKLLFKKQIDEEELS